MASILDRYGIKEVADVTFYEINDDGSIGKPALFLDTLKVSTIEQTASTSDARGGKGNPVLISWDYGKEINLSIQDALFSPKSMNIMFGTKGSNLSATSSTVTKTAKFRLDENGCVSKNWLADVYDSENGSARKYVRLLDYDASAQAGSKWSASTSSSTIANNEVLFNSNQITMTGVFLEDGTELKYDSDGTGVAAAVSLTSPSVWAQYNNAVSPATGATSTNANKICYVQYTIKVSKSVITINGNSFPGTYYVTGDTYARSDVTGKDQFFQFIIKKAKMQAENTITLEAEGDPSVFNMNLKVLRPDDGVMMELVQYDLVEN